MVGFIIGVFVIAGMIKGTIGLGLVFTVSTICLAVFLQQNPIEDIPLDYKMSLIALLPALVGM
jgi:ABC-type glycerol-3-phosphate transport system permease component